MTKLDCFDLQSATISICHIYEITPHEVLEFMENISYEKGGGFQSSYIFDKFSKLYTIASYDSTCWYHLTTSSCNAEFESGLKPLNSVVDKICHGIIAILDLSLEKSRRIKSWLLKSAEEMSFAGYTLDMRFRYESQQGPYGGLIRDFAFYSSDKRDYFRRPSELAEDILKDINDNFGVDITEDYMKSCCSYIVKFETQDAQNECIESCLNYIYKMITGESLDSECIYYKNMSGAFVEPISIERFEKAPELIHIPSASLSRNILENM